MSHRHVSTVAQKGQTKKGTFAFLQATVRAREVGGVQIIDLQVKCEDLLLLFAFFKICNQIYLVSLRQNTKFKDATSDSA